MNKYQVFNYLVYFTHQTEFSSAFFFNLYESLCCFEIYFWFANATFLKDETIYKKRKNFFNIHMRT